MVRNMFRCVFISAILIIIKAEDSTLSLLKYKDLLYCVLSNDSTNTAITWGTQNEPTSYDYYNITELDGVQGRNWKLENSLENVFGFGPILDYRWESFPLRNHCRHQLPVKETYELSISVLETDTVYLCGTINYEQCYTITFGVTGPYPSSSTPNATRFCKNPNVHSRYQKWLHITITYGNNTMIIKQQGFNTTYVVLQNVYYPRFLVIPGKWKLHAYNVYSSQQTGEVKLTLKDDLFRTTARVCLGLLVKAPVNDALTLTLQGDYSNTIASVTSKARNNWEELELCAEIKPNSNMKILIATKSRNSRVSIADIIRIISKEYVSTAWTSTITFNCSKCLLHVLYLTTETGGQKLLRCNQHCSHTTIGANCIPCQTFFNQIHCEKDVPICELKMSGTTNNILCSCPSGYVGKNCTEQCPEGYHGFNCRERCNCTECNHITGACSMNTRMDNCYSTGESSGNSTYDISTMQNGATLGVSLRLGECNTKGKLIVYDIHLECISNWCSPNNSYHMNSTTDVTHFPILGYTNYSITIETHGEIQYRKVKTSFLTTPTAPNAVRDFIVYRITNTSVGLRWLEPYPPTGLLDEYTVSYGWPQLSRNIPANSSSCKIWTNYICSTIDGLKFKRYYLFEIYAKNYNVTEISTLSRTYATTEDKVPAAPENLTYFWKETSDALIIKWNYPNIPIGNITNFIASIFDKTISLFKDFEDLAEYTYQFEYEELKANSSSNVSLTVYSYNGDAGLYSSPSKINVVIPPKTPKFTKSPTVVNVTAASFKLLLPNITDIDGEKSLLYVIITTTESTPKPNPQQQEIFKKANISADISWIAWIQTITHDETEIDVPFTSEKHVNFKTISRVTLLLTNVYKNISRYSVYIIDLRTSQEPNYNLLLLLLLIPVMAAITFYLYKKYKRGFVNDVPTQNIYEEIEFLPDPDEYSQVVAITTGVETNFSKRIKIQDLQDYMKECMTNGEIAKQYETLSTEYVLPKNYQADEQLTSTNKSKNITLRDHAGKSLKNASYLTGGYINVSGADEVYISTRIPHSDMVESFWSMIWQENVKFIIMLSSLSEMQEEKVKKYWPDFANVADYGEMSVAFVGQTIYAEYETKILKISFQGKEREVHHLHFRSWPDNGASFYPESLASFLKKVITIPLDGSPIVVQCSNGIEKTGTLLLCDICVRMAIKIGEVDVYQQLYNLRIQQANAVNDVYHYKLVHLIVFLCTVAPDYTVECTEEMGEKVEELMTSSKLCDQMIYIEEAFWQDNAIQPVYDKVADPIIHNKNRFNDVIPESYARIILTPNSSSDLTTSYINAVKVNGFGTPSKFIVTQYPMPHTLTDFWRLVEQYDVTVIICLNKLELRDRTCCKFYPSNDETMEPAPSMEIRWIDTETTNYYNMFTLNLTCTYKQQTDKTIKLLHLNYWNYSMAHPNSPAELLPVYDKMNTLARPPNPILVTCLDGAHASGLYTSLCCLIDKVRIEHVCDVCLAVRIVRRSRKEFMRRPEQFRFLYRSAAEYVYQLSNYSNFFIRKY
ncbi:hypothetical protein Trydic_g22475 [Trypoxylus dichotomus]